MKFCHSANLVSSTQKRTSKIRTVFWLVAMGLNESSLDDGDNDDDDNHHDADDDDEKVGKMSNF